MQKSPQKENGYTPIANELLEQFLRFNFTKRQLLVIMTIARMTYGYSRKTDATSSVQIANLTKIDRPDVSRTINQLVRMNVINKHREGRQSHGVFVSQLSINKHYDKWITDGELLSEVNLPQVVKSLITDGKSHTKRIVNHPTHKEIKTTKTSIKKTSIPINFSISDRVKSWAEKNRYDELEKHLENFIFICEKNAYKYANWDSAFMDAIRKNWAKIIDTKSLEPEWAKDML
jgi:phage replication O-like protein O